MPNRRSRWRLPEAYEDIARKKRPLEKGLMARANVVGVGVGNKYIGGEDTGTPCIVVMVSSKLPLDALDEDDVVPPVLEGVPTDVIETGPIRPSAFDLRMRPAPGGVSLSRETGINPVEIGTLGTGCWDADDIGRPPHLRSRYYLLSCNHVIADLNQGMPGDPVLQPALGDGGTPVVDRIANLSRWVDIQWCTAMPGGGTSCPTNFADAGIAETDLDHVDREIHWIGHPRSLPPGGGIYFLAPGQRIQKTGRTTELTVGRITAVSAIVGPILYPNSNFAVFRDVITTTLMSAPGDSGAVACDLDFNVAIGMVFASGTNATFLNPAGWVEDLLNIVIGPPWL